MGNEMGTWRGDIENGNERGSFLLALNERRVA